MKLKQSLLVLSLIVLGVLFAACGGGGTTGGMVQLTVTKGGDGNGTVTSTPAGINLTLDNETESADYTKGASVILTATPAADSTFAGFSDNCLPLDGVVNQCAITLNAAATVTATFSQQGGETPVVNGVTVTPAALALQVGSTGQLSADVDQTGGAAETVTWKSSDDAIATVDQTGMVTAVGVGDATITATSTADATKSGSATVTVTTTPPPPTVNSVTIDEGPQTLKTGDTFDYNATVDVSGGADDSVTWETSDPTVAAVDPTSGLVTAGVDGTATITARSVADPAKFAEVTVTVNNAAPNVTDVEMPVATSSDDAEEYVSAFTVGSNNFAAGQVELGSSALELTYEPRGTGTQEVVGVRFDGLSIPQNATITSAVIRFTAKRDDAAPVTLSIAAQNDVAAPTFEATTNNISSRTKTTATASWEPEAWAAGMSYDTADLAPVVQELLAQGDISAIAFIITGSGTDFRQAQSFSGAGKNTTARPTLVLSYTTP